MIAFSDTQLHCMSLKYYVNFGSSIHARTSFVSFCILQFCQQRNLPQLIEANPLFKGENRNWSQQFAHFTCLGGVRNLVVLFFILYLILLAVGILSSVSVLSIDLINDILARNIVPWKKNTWMHHTTEPRIQSPFEFELKFIINWHIFQHFTISGILIFLMLFTLIFLTIFILIFCQQFTFFVLF